MPFLQPKATLARERLPMQMRKPMANKSNQPRDIQVDSLPLFLNSEYAWCSWRLYSALPQRGFRAI